MPRNKKSNAAPAVEVPVTKSVQEKIHGDDYVTKVPYPQKSDYQIKEVVKTQKLGERVLTGFDSEGYAAARKAHNLDQQRLDEEFKTDAFRELGISNHPKREVLYNKAYDLGHSAGNSEIWGYMVDLVELIQD